MAFVPYCEHDIFVSYAHVDDEPAPGVEKGWVTTLVEGLRGELARKLGRSDSCSIWMDHQLSRHVQITPEIMDTLQKTAILLVILSPGYIASEWCERERCTFLAMVQERVRSGSRVFIVEFDEVTERPCEFEDLLGYRFWVRGQEGEPPRTLGMPQLNPDNLRDQPYYDRLNKLRSNLAEELKQLKETAETPAPVTSVQEPEEQESDSRPVVFLAEVTDDLEPLRDEVKGYLDQAGLRVLPETWYPRNPTAFREAVDRDIAQSVLFAQLLSDAAGKKSPDLPSGYTGLQYKLATESGKPVLQWRRPDLDMDKIREKDAHHCDFLERNTVVAVGIEEFKQRIVDRAFYRPPPPVPKRTNALIFVDTETEDRSLAEAVCDVLDRYGVGHALPVCADKPAESRSDLEGNLLECDALIIIYARATVTWVRGQLLQCRKASFKRERPLGALAIYEGPPAPKDPLGMKLSNMQTLDCSMGLNEGELKSFLDSIQPERNP